MEAISDATLGADWNACFVAVLDTDLKANLDASVGQIQKQIWTQI